MNKVAYDNDILHRRRRLSPRLHSDAQLVNPAVSVAYFESFAETSMLLEEQNSTSTLRRDHHHPCPQAPGANYSHFRPLLHKNDRRSAFALTHSLTHPPTHFDRTIPLTLEVVCQRRILINKRLHGLQAFRFGPAERTMVERDAVVYSSGTVLAENRRKK